jgi:hypothetical protein
MRLVGRVRAAFARTTPRSAIHRKLGGLASKDGRSPRCHMARPKHLRQHMTSHFAQRGTLSLAAALVTSVVAALALAGPNPSLEEERAAPALEACGTPGAMPCPLQAWMRANVASPLASNKMSSLADGLDRAARLSPDAGWGSWSTFATQGAEAARRGDVAGARASCKGCHDAWRDAYKAKHRNRPVPR